MAIKILKNERLWIESDAIKQLENISHLNYVENIIGLPDLHPGKVPIGATFQTKGAIYPFLIGNDIGCGMSLFDTNIKMKKFDLDLFSKKLEGTSIRGECSIGGGNHFAELQCIEKIYNKEYGKKCNLDSKHLYVLVHSGSRNMGDQIYKKYLHVKSLRINTDEFQKYMKDHNNALKYARDNRKQVVDILMKIIGIKHDNQCIVDCFHNIITEFNGKFYHHKGSISTIYNEYAIIAGSRGSYSYLVKCKSTNETLFSISHGAGRKWARNLCKGRLVSKYHKKELKNTTLGGRVITDKKELYYEEATEAYKDIEQVIQILLENNAIEIVAKFKPLITYKC